MDAKLKMDSLVRLSDIDLSFLMQWSAAKASDSTFPLFGQWLLGTIHAEVTRRGDPQFEAGMTIPPPFDVEVLSQSLVGAYVLARLPLTEAAAKFADELELHVMTSASAMLSEIGATAQ